MDMEPGETFTSEEIATLWTYLRQTMEKMTEIGGEITQAELHWQPPALETNSIAVLLVHTMGSIEESLLGTLCGGTVNRDRDAEFVEYAVTGAELAGQWRTLQARLESALRPLPDSKLGEPLIHPRRGPLSGREVLLAALAHAREHLGQAELTRDLARVAPSAKE
jgi:hypothetical protein